MRHLFKSIDVMAVLPTGRGKSLIFQMFVVRRDINLRRLLRIFFSAKARHGGESFCSDSRLALGEPLRASERSTSSERKGRLVQLGAREF